MKKAAMDKVWMDKDLRPDTRPHSKSMHMITARTTDASKPAIKANAHNNIVATKHFNLRKGTLFNGFNAT